MILMSTYILFLIILGYLTAFVIAAVEFARTFKSKLKQEILGEIVELKSAILKDPDAFLKEFEPLIVSLLKNVMANGQKEIQSGIPMIKLPIIGKVPASMIMPFLQSFGKKFGIPGVPGASESQTEGSNPFDK